MIERKLNRRLLSAASLVRQGAVFADIGTDHAYLPIFLLDEGRISRAVATDINEGPLASAERNVSDAGYSAAVTFRLTDGAASLAELGITDYAICGMGGELIAEIISHAPHLFDEKLRLILQPMTRQAYLRKYLLSHGFDIEREIYTEDGGKYYTCMLVSYSGVRRDISEEEATLGLGSTHHTGDGRVGYLRARLSSLRRAADGKLRGGVAFPSELALISAIERLIPEILENNT